MHLSNMSVRNYLYAIGVGGLLLNVGCSNAEPVSSPSAVQDASEDAALELTAFSGEGHNGPDLEGPAAPTTMDRSFDPKQLVKATEKCTSELMKSFYKQFFRREWTNEQITKSVGSVVNAHKELTAEDGGPLDVYVGYTGEIKNQKGSTLSFSATGYTYGPSGIIEVPSAEIPYPSPYSYHSRGIIVTLNVAPDDIGNCCAEKMQFGLPWGRPALRFDRKLTDLQYDEYGRLISFKETAANLGISAIAYTKDSSGNRIPTESSSMPLYNIQKFAYDIKDFPVFAGPSKVTFDAPAYKRCLKGELEL